MDRLTLITLAAHQPNRAIQRRVGTSILVCAKCLCDKPDHDDNLPHYSLPWHQFNSMTVCDECMCQLEFTPIKPSLKEPTP